MTEKKRSKTSRATQEVEAEPPTIAEEPEERIKYQYHFVNPNTGDLIGKYYCYNAKSAAGKGFTKWIQKNKLEIDPDVFTLVYVREADSKLNNEVYGFEIQRIHAEEPRKKKVWDEKKGEYKKIPYFHRNKIRKAIVTEEVLAWIENAKQQKRLNAKLERQRRAKEREAENKGEEKSNEETQEPEPEPEPEKPTAHKTKRRTRKEKEANETV